AGLLEFRLSLLAPAAGGSGAGRWVARYVARDGKDLRGRTDPGDPAAAGSRRTGPRRQGGGDVSVGGNDGVHRVGASDEGSAGGDAECVHLRWVHGAWNGICLYDGEASGGVDLVPAPHPDPAGRARYGRAMRA